jgi:hypothetical protein
MKKHFMVYSKPNQKQDYIAVVSTHKFTPQGLEEALLEFENQKEESISVDLSFGYKNKRTKIKEWSK